MSLIGPERHQREQAQQRWRGAGNRLVRPLALRLHAEMAAHLRKRHLDRPAPHEPAQDVHRIGLQIRAQEKACGSNSPATSRTSTQRIGTRLPGWYQSAVPEAMSSSSILSAVPVVTVTRRQRVAGSPAARQAWLASA